MPIFRACSIWLRQLVLGWMSVKWSLCSWAHWPSTLVLMAGAALTASIQAWSRATGSKLANMPMSGTTAASFSAWQSQ